MCLLHPVMSLKLCPNLTAIIVYASFSLPGFVPCLAEVSVELEGTAFKFEILKNTLEEVTIEYVIKAHLFTCSR